MLKNRTMTIYFVFFYVLHLIFELPQSSEGKSFDVIVDELNVGVQKSYTLNSRVIFLIEIKNISDVIERLPPRIYVKCETCTENHPLLVFVSENKGVMSLELPIVIESNNYRSIYKNIERTLCPYDIKSMSNYNIIEQEISHPVTIALTTSSHVDEKVELLVNLEKNFVLQLNENKTVQISSSTPAFYLFEFPSENVTSVLLEVTSEDDICLIVSVQNVSCPVFDLEENIAYRGSYQTVTRQGGFSLTNQTFPNGFYVVLVVSEDDRYCSSVLLNSSLNRSKNIIINVSRNISVEDYLVAVSITLLVIILFCAIMFIIFLCSLQKDKNTFPDLAGDDEEVEPSTSTSALPDSLKNSETQETLAPATGASLDAENLSTKTDSSLDETDFDIVYDAEFDKNIFRAKCVLFLSDLARKNPTVLKKKSDLYFKSLIIVSTFYFLPVIQLLFSDQYVSIIYLFKCLQLCDNLNVNNLDI